MTYATLNFGSKSRNVLNNVIQNTGRNELFKRAQWSKWRDVDVTDWAQVTSTSFYIDVISKWRNSYFPFNIGVTRDYFLFNVDVIWTVEESSSKSSPERQESGDDAVRRRSDGIDERVAAEDSERRRSDGEKPVKKRKR